MHFKSGLEKGRGNGTVCRCVKVKVKGRAVMTWKNWEGRKVNTVSVDYLEWVMFEHWPKPPKNIPRTFKLTAKTLTCCVVQFPLATDCDTLKIALGNVKVKQIPVNSNIATTVSTQSTRNDKGCLDCGLLELHFCKLGLCCFIKGAYPGWFISLHAFRFG